MNKKLMRNILKKLEKIAIRALISQNINSKLDVSPKIIYNYYNDNIVEFSNPKKIKYFT